jgi:hypothetical protein
MQFSSLTSISRFTGLHHTDDSWRAIMNRMTLAQRTLSPGALLPARFPEPGEGSINTHRGGPKPAGKLN